METASFETRHGERRPWLSSGLTGLQLGEAHGTQTRLEMNAPLVSGPRLTIAETREWFGVAAQKFALTARCVTAVERLSREGHSRAPEQSLPSWGEMLYHHPAQMALQRRMIDHLMGECQVLIVRIDRLKARQIVVGDVPIVGFGPSRTGGTRPPVHVTQRGITPELAAQGHLQRADAVDELLLAARALHDPILARLELLCRHDAFNRGQRGVDTGLRRVALQRRGGLFHAERIGAVRGDIDPGQRGHLAALFRTTVGAVPEHVETRGLLTTVGHNTGGKGADVLVVGRDDMDDSRVVEADKITVTFTLSGKGFLVIRTITTQMAARHSSWHQQHQTPHVTQKFLLGCLGVFHAHQYTLTQLHRAFSLPVEGILNRTG
jgi:hypothetical protein